MPAQTCSQGGLSLKTLETPKHAWWSQAKFKAKDPKPTKSTPPLKGLEKSSGPTLGKESGDLRLQEQCRQVMCQPDAITTAMSPSKTPALQTRGRNGELEPPVALVPTLSTPMSPNYLHLVMNQCGLRLNE